MESDHDSCSWVGNAYALHVQKSRYWFLLVSEKMISVRGGRVRTVQMDQTDCPLEPGHPPLKWLKEDARH